MLANTKVLVNLLKQKNMWSDLKQAKASSDIHHRKQHKILRGSAQESKGRFYICFIFNINALWLKKLLNALKKLSNYTSLGRKKMQCFYSKGVGFIYWYFCGIPGSCGEKVLVMGNHCTFWTVLACLPLCIFNS